MIVTTKVESVYNLFDFENDFYTTTDNYIIQNTLKSSIYNQADEVLAPYHYNNN